MGANLLFGVLFYGGGFALLGLLRADAVVVAWYAVFGTVLGLIMGARWHRQDKRTARYRSQFDPAGPTLTPGSLAPPPGPAPAVTRYRADPASTVALPLLLAAAIPIAIWMALNEDPFWLELLFWAVVLIVPLAVMALVVLFTYTEVGPRGIRLRTPFRSRTFTWSELAEVGWLRTKVSDIVVLSTQDGRQVKTVGIAVSATGVGRERALRMLAAIEHHWASIGAQTSTTSPGAATSIGPS